MPTPAATPELSFPTIPPMLPPPMHATTDDVKPVVSTTVVSGTELRDGKEIPLILVLIEWTYLDADGGVLEYHLDKYEMDPVGACDLALDLREAAVPLIAKNN